MVQVVQGVRRDILESQGSRAGQEVLEGRLEIHHLGNHQDNRHLEVRRQGSRHRADRLEIRAEAQEEAGSCRAEAHREVQAVQLAEEYHA